MASNEDDYRAQVKLLRDWGFTVKEQSGCYGRSNGTKWKGVNGKRVGQINHHYVSPLAPPANPMNYVNAMVSGTVVNWVIDAVGVIYLIGTGPMNHAGNGDSSVLARVKSGQAPTGWHPPKNDFTGNQDYDGVELLHPGDSSPYPDAMINATVALNASRCIIMKQSANTSIMHGEHTNRKIDMSWRGGPKGDGGPELRKRVAARMSQAGGAPPAAKPPTAQPNPPTTGDDDLPLNQADKDWITSAIRGQLNVYFASGEGNPNTGRIVQAIKNHTPWQVDQIWNEVMPNNASGGSPEKSEPGRKARDTMGALMTMISRMYRK